MVRNCQQAVLEDIGEDVYVNPRDFKCLIFKDFVGRDYEDSEEYNRAHDVWMSRKRLFRIGEHGHYKSRSKKGKIEIPDKYWCKNNGWECEK